MNSSWLEKILTNLEHREFVNGVYSMFLRADKADREFGVHLELGDVAELMAMCASILLRHGANDSNIPEDFTVAAAYIVEAWKDVQEIEGEVIE